MPGAPTAGNAGSATLQIGGRDGQDLPTPEMKISSSETLLHDPPSSFSSFLI